METLLADGRPLLILFAILLVACGGFAIFQATTGHFMPHDTAYLGMTASELSARHGDPILRFMIHDRVSFGGVLIAIGVIYLWLVLFPLQRQESWAWWTLALSGVVGFLSFLSYLGYGYLDTWHGIGTMALAPLFLVGLLRARTLRRLQVEPLSLDLRSGPGVGRALLVLSSIGIVLAGLTITIVGMTTVFVPQDLEFIGMTRAAIDAIHPHLIPLIAHDRAGFGGALVTFGVAMFASVRYARPSRALRQALAIAGVVGFGAAVGVHPAVGYLDFVHLAPAVLASIIFAVGLALTRALPSRDLP